VGVNVSVGTVGVKEGSSVGVFVSVGTGVEFPPGKSIFREQDKSIMENSVMAYIFFIAESF